MARHSAPLAVALLALLSGSPGTSASDVRAERSLRTNPNCTRILFVFGDNLIDVGVNNYFTQPGVNVANSIPPLRASWDPWGLDFKPQSGRFTNGQNLADFIGGAMGIGKSPPPFNSLPLYDRIPKSTIQNGISFASGGAGYLDETNRGRCIPFSQQVGNFTGGGPFTGFAAKYTNQELSDAIYLISLGANDLFTGNANANFVPMSLVLKAALEALYARGARKFAVANIGAAGCTPYNRDTLPLEFGQTVINTTNGCIDFVNSRARAFNALLYNNSNTGILQAFAAAFPAAKVVNFDQYGASLDTNQRPRLYGLDSNQAAVACCGDGGRYNGFVNCGTSQNVENPPIYQDYTLCNDRSKRIYFDYNNPSSRSHEIYYNRVFWGETYTGQYTFCPRFTGRSSDCRIMDYLFTC